MRPDGRFLLLVLKHAAFSGDMAAMGEAAGLARAHSVQLDDMHWAGALRAATQGVSPQKAVPRLRACARALGVTAATARGAAEGGAALPSAQDMVGSRRLPYGLLRALARAYTAAGATPDADWLSERAEKAGAAAPAHSQRGARRPAPRHPRTRAHTGTRRICTEACPDGRAAPRGPQTVERRPTGRALLLAARVGRRALLRR